jgi:hypothetical protein
MNGWSDGQDTDDRYVRLREGYGGSVRRAEE